MKIRQEIYRAAEMGDYQSAIKAIAGLLLEEHGKKQPDEALLGSLYADLYYFYSQILMYEDAEHYHHLAQDYLLKGLGPNPDPNNPLLIKLNYDAARIAEALGHYADALTGYQALLETDRATDVKFRIALCLQGVKQYEVADNFYNQAYFETLGREGQYTMKVADMLYHWGNLQVTLGNYPRALTFFGLAKVIVSEINPDNGSSLRDLDQSISEVTEHLSRQSPLTSLLMFSKAEPDPLPELYPGMEFSELSNDTVATEPATPSSQTTKSSLA